MLCCRGALQRPTASKRPRSRPKSAQHECFLHVRTPRVKLPDGRVALVEPEWFGKLAGFTLLLEALVLAMPQQMSFAAVAKLVGLSWHRVHAICSRYVDLALSEADLSTVQAVAIDETSSQRGHNYLTIAADAEQRRVVFVTDASPSTSSMSSPMHPLLSIRCAGLNSVPVQA